MSGILDPCKDIREEALGAFTRYLSDPTEDFQGILSSMKADVFNVIKTSWRDSAKLRENLQNLRKGDKKTWLCFWRAVINKLGVTTGPTFDALWSLSPFPREIPISIAMSETGQVLNDTDALVKKILSDLSEQRGIELRPGSELVILVRSPIPRKVYEIKR